MNIRLVLRGTLIAALIHFAVVMSANFVARGFDLDQLTSRSKAANAADSVTSLLEYPHSLFIRGLSSEWMAALTPYFGMVYVAHSLLWGLVLYIAWHWFRRRRFQN